MSNVDFSSFASVPSSPSAGIVPARETTTSTAAAKAPRGRLSQFRRLFIDFISISGLLEQPLDLGGIRRLRQREAEKHARLLRVELHRGDEAELVVVELDVAANDSAADTRAANHDHTLCGRGRKGVDHLLR